MKLTTQLLIAPLLTGAVALGSVGFNAAFSARETSASQARYQERLNALHGISAAQDQVGLLHVSVYRTITLIASLDEARVKDFRGRIATELDGLKRAIAANQDADLKQQIVLATRQIDTYRGQADAAVDLSTIDPNTGVAALQSADATFGTLNRALATMTAHIEQAGVARAEAAEAHARQVAVILFLVAVAATGLAIGIAVRQQRRLVGDLRHASALADSVSHGNLVVSTHTPRQDEVGDLMRSLGAMAAQLQTSIRSVSVSSESIRTASVEIASGNLDLSVRTEQTASNLQRAASSIEQLNATVRQSADSARQANQLVASAAEVAQRGGSVVGEVVATMDEINTSSRKIADIIGVIDGIAFQTNILALNAAVEAARAGEQGRGFAVVASEVRSLAQRSALAAREIKGLIGASVDKVEDGSKLVAAAGQTMQEIVGAVQRVSDIIGEITAAAAEQSDSIGEVNASVGHLDRMTQQNAALVEQSAAAAESLKDQAQLLAGVVQVFRLDAGAAAPAPLPVVKPVRRAAVRPGPAQAPAPNPGAAEPAKAPARTLASAPGVPSRPAASHAPAAAGDGGWETF